MLIELILLILIIWGFKHLKMGFFAPPPTFKKIEDKYKSVQEVLIALKDSGLESSNLIIGIDFTTSNRTQGGNHMFTSSDLHDVSHGQNPYQKAISVIGRTLEHLDEDKIIPVFGFGDHKTKNNAVFPILNKQGSYCVGVEQVLLAYTDVVDDLILSGPTNFAPIINKAIDIVQSGPRKEYHILLIVTDGQVCECDRQKTIDAIVKATDYPLSIIIIGVGNGPFGEMEEYDDELTERRFDNLQFVNFYDVMKNGKDDDFALAAMMELPEQYKEIRRLKLLQ